MIPKRLTLGFFKTFQEPEVFHFPQPCRGFHLITGENRKYPELGGNATGKSALWDGLAWVQFGKTSRGLKGPDVANWEHDGVTQGEFCFTRGKTLITVARTRLPASLTIQEGKGEPRTVTQPEIDAILGYDYNGFLACILMGQFNRFFFDLGATEKLQVFSDILGLKFWQDRAKDAGGRAAKASDKVDELSLTLTEIRTEHKILVRQFNSEEKLSRQFDKEQARRTNGVRTRIRENEATLERLEQNKPKQPSPLKRADNEREVIRLDKVTKELQAQVNRLTAASETAQAQARNYRAEITRIKTAKEQGVCPTCGTRLKGNPGHIKREIERLTGLAQGKAAAALLTAEESANVTAELKEQQRELHEQLTRLNTNRQGDNERQRTWAEYRRKHENAQRDLQESEREYKRLKDETNIHAQRVVSVKKQLKRIRETIREAESKLKTNEQRRNGYGYWAKEFKNLRLWLIEESLRQLEVEIANSLLQIGLRGWAINFEIERATQSGGVSKGFSVLIQSPASPERVKWETWCGGETQRLRIAGAIGLSALIRNRFGITTPLEVWDEPTTHLSREGIDDLLAFFEGRSAEEQRQIWLVEHHSEIAGNFNSRVRVIRTKHEGSVIRGNRTHFGVME